MIEQLFTISLWIFGIRVLFMEGMLLGFWGDEFDELFGIMAKPLFRCAPCMASIHGTLYYIYMNYMSFTWPMFFVSMVFFVVCLTGLNWMISRLMSIYVVLDDIKENMGKVKFKNKLWSKKDIKKFADSLIMDKE